jgi:hypothetical protein
MRASQQRGLTVLVAAMAAVLPLRALAQAQVVKPPISQLYIDLATSASDIPGMGMMAGAARGGQSGGLFGALGGMMKGAGGGGSGGNVFGNTHAAGFGAPGKYMDISVSTVKNPTLQEAQQAIPEMTGMGAPLKLLSPPPPDKPLPPEKDEAPEPQYEKPKPKAKISLYWGCGATVRPGQPRTLDMSKSSMEDYTKFFTMRSSNSRGARLRYGEPSWPNKVDDRRVPDSASVAGEHRVTGQGIPDSFKFTLDDRQDLLSPIALTQQKMDGVTLLEWQPVTYARGYFITVMGAKGERGGRPGSSGDGEGTEMVMWTSSELPEMGYALVDYQTNGSIEQWLKDKVLLAPATTKCAVPKGIFGDEGAGMLRMVAYGGEHFLGYPKRPTDPKVPYEPEWQVKVRNKSTFFSMLGGMPGGREHGDGNNPNQPQQQEQPSSGVGGLLKGLFGK